MSPSVICWPSTAPMGVCCSPLAYSLAFDKPQLFLASCRLRLLVQWVAVFALGLLYTAVNSMYAPICTRKCTKIVHTVAQVMAGGAIS